MNASSNKLNSVHFVSIPNTIDEVPCNSKHALELNKKNGNIKWFDTNVLEHKNRINMKFLLTKENMQSSIFPVYITKFMFILYLTLSTMTDTEHKLLQIDT